MNQPEPSVGHMLADIVGSLIAIVIKTGTVVLTLRFLGVIP